LFPFVKEIIVVGFFLLLVLCSFVFFIFRFCLGIGTLGYKMANLATAKRFERKLSFVLPVVPESVLKA
jgi:hypothetical protein